MVRLDASLHAGKNSLARTGSQLRESNGNEAASFKASPLLADKAGVDEIIKEFVVESQEGLDTVERRVSELRAGGSDAAACVADIFRAIHTIKGTVGFLGFPRLERMAHAGEHLLGVLRDGKIACTDVLLDTLLSLSDRLRRMLLLIDATGSEGARAEDMDEPLVARMRELGEPAALDAREQPCSPGHSREPATSGELAVLAEPTASGPRDAEDGAHRGPESELEAHHGGSAEQTLRVDVSTLNRLMNLVGELVQTRNQIVRAGRDGDEFAHMGQRLDSVTIELRETVMRARMQPVSQLFGKFPRLVREVAQSCEKRVRLLTDGGDTGLDKSLLESLKDPLMHAVRNAIDHGIEAPHERTAAGKPAEGTVWLRAFQEGSHVVVEISDDGAGVRCDKVRQRAEERGLVSRERLASMSDAEVAQLVFEPGFSTRDAVTMISGRGVGMDVVRANVERTGGTVELASEPGQGTTLRMRVPLTLAIIPALLARSGGQSFAIPRSSLLEMVIVQKRELDVVVQHIGKARVFRLRNHLIPLLSLSEVLDLPGSTADFFYIAVLEAKGQQFGLMLDDMDEPQEIVAKPLAAMLRDLNVFSGATLLGNGDMALILDTVGLARSAGLCTTVESVTVASEPAAAPANAAEGTSSMLVFRDQRGERRALPLEAIERIESISPSAVEVVSGRTMLQYRGEVLPLEDHDALQSTELETGEPGKSLVLICRPEGGRGRRLGIAVREVLDIAQGEVTAPSSHGGMSIARVHGKLASLDERFAISTPEAKHVFDFALHKEAA